MSARPHFIDEEDVFMGRYGNTVWKTVRIAYSRFWWRLAFCFTIGLIGRLLLLSNANILGVWVDSFAGPPQSLFKDWTSIQFIKLLLIVTGVGMVLTISFRVIFARISAHAVSLIYDETTLRTSRFPMRFFDATPVGRIVTRFSSDYGNVFRLFGGPLAEFIGIMFDLIAMLILITLAHPAYLVLCLLIAILNYIVYRLNRHQLRSERRELSRVRSPSIAHFAETMQGASTIRVFSKQSSFTSQFTRLNELFLTQRLRTSRKILSFSFQMNALTSLLFFLTGITGMFLIQKGAASVGSLGVAFAFIILSGAAIQMFFEWLSQFEEAMTGMERLDRYLRHPIETGASLPPSAQFQTGQLISAEQNKFELQASKSVAVEFKDVSFRYRDDLETVLHQLSFDVKPGERLGVVGRTGSGKTSLIQALFYLYPLQQGVITLHGRSPILTGDSYLALAEYRKHIALITQEPVLLRGLLRENLMFSQSKSDQRVSDTEMIRALEQVGLGQWWRSFEGGLDGTIEERGRNLSLGERQLVCMARCLLQNAPLVIMDEATSSVDPHSEEMMNRATHEVFSGRTQVIIAHRLSTLQSCDRILWLEAGHIKMWDEATRVLHSFKSQSEFLLP